MSANACRLGYRTTATASHSWPGSASSARPPMPKKTGSTPAGAPSLLRGLDVFAVPLASAVGLKVQQVQDGDRTPVSSAR